MSVLDSNGQVIEVRCSVNHLIGRCSHFAVRIADWQCALKNGLFQQLISFWCSYLRQTVLYFFVCPEVFKGDRAGFIRGKFSVGNVSGRATFCKAVAVIHRLPGIAVLVLQQESSPEQRLTIGVLLRDSDGARAAVILGGVLNLRIVPLHRPDSGVVLA